MKHENNGISLSEFRQRILQALFLFSSHLGVTVRHTYIFSTIYATNLITQHAESEIL